MRKSILSASTVLSLALSSSVYSMTNTPVDVDVIYSNLSTLGASYDDVKNIPLGQRCIAKSASDLLLENKPVAYTDWSLEVFSSTKEMHKYLTSTRGGNASGTYYNISGDGGYSSRISKETHLNTDEHAIAGFFVSTTSHLSSKSTGRMQDLTSEAQAAYSDNLTKFRDLCGDGYVSGVTKGVVAQFSIKIESANGSTKVSREKSADLQTKVLGFVGGGISGSERTELERRFSTYRMSVNTATLGYKSGGFKTQVMGIGGLIDFINTLNDKTLYQPVAIQVDFSKYQFSTLRYADKKLNYSKWISVDIDQNNRCARFYNGNGFPNWAENREMANSLLNNGKNISLSCSQAGDMIRKKSQECSISGKFSLCVSPMSYTCSDGGVSCSDVINGDLVPAWGTSFSSHFRYAQKFKSGRTHVREVTYCLPQGTMFDLTRGDKGYYRTSNNRNSIHTHKKLNYRCDKTTFSVKSKGGINFSSDIYLYGIKAYKTPLLNVYQ